MTKRIRYLILVLLVVALSSLMMGCNGKNSNANEERNIITVNPLDNEEQQPLIEDMAVLTDVVDKVPVVLYFANEQGQLVAQRRDIPKVDGIARMTIHELAKGPEQQGMLPPLPNGTKLKDISIKDGLCTVDFSSELRENHAGGSAGELMTVYAIVNTLTQFSTVQQVQILVNGEMVDTLAGHVDLSVPLERNDTIITSANK
jgi:spore germination protein GerM